MAVFGAAIDAVSNNAMTDKTNWLNSELTERTNLSNRQIAASTNQANKEMTRETNATNLQIAQEANALAVQEADKSYERSTATNQIAELMRAGFSSQQAKEIVAGSGSAPSYSAAPVVAPTMQAATAQGATMQAPHMEHSSTNFAAGLSSLDSMAGSLFNSLQDPNGGSLGAALSAEAIDAVYSHHGEDGFSIDDVSTVADMENYARDKPDDHWSKQLVSSKAWKRLKSSPCGIKGYAAGMSSYADTGTKFQGLKQSVIESRCSLVRENLLGIQYDREVIAKTRENLLKNREEELADVYDELSLRTAQNSIAQMILEYGKNTNTRYVQAVLDEAISDKETAIILHKVAACDNQATLQLYKNNPDFAEIVQFYRHMASAGLRLTEQNGNLVVLGLRKGTKLQSDVDLANIISDNQQAAEDYFDDYISDPLKHMNPIDRKYDSIVHPENYPATKRRKKSQYR